MFILLALISLSVLLSSTPRAITWDRSSIIFSIAMASPTMAIFISQAYHLTFSAPEYDWAARFLFAIPIYLALRQIRLEILPYLQAGLAIGALVALAYIFIAPYNWPLFIYKDRFFEFHRYTTGQFANPIHFANITLSISFLCFSASIFPTQKRLLIILPMLLGGCAGMYLALQCSERTTWITIPVLAFVWIFFLKLKHPVFKIIIFLSTIALCAWVAFHYFDGIKARIDSIQSELADIKRGINNTSIEVRLKIWALAWQLFLDNPVFGLGAQGFSKAITAFEASGQVSPLVADFGRGEVHNEILAKCVGMGIPGLLSILLVYLAPIYIFFKVPLENPARRLSVVMGIGFVTAFFVFGLTVEIFNLKMTAAFFSMTLAILLAIATHEPTSKES